MSWGPEQKSDAEKAVDIVRDAGGQLVGRTRLQKTAYLLELAGVGEGFSFEYRHFGPYSEELASAVQIASLLGLLNEDERPTSWGGFYSIFSTDRPSDDQQSSVRRALASKGAGADPIELELAATAVFLFSKGEIAAWRETAKRKPEKARDGRLEKAKALYERLRAIPTPSPLPEIG